MKLDVDILVRVLYVVSFGLIFVGTVIGFTGAHLFIDWAGFYAVYAVMFICIGLALNGVSFALLWAKKKSICIWNDMYHVLESQIKKKER